MKLDDGAQWLVRTNESRAGASTTNELFYLFTLAHYLFDR